MKDSNLISIVVPMYGTEDYLTDCLDSILGQDHRNLEVICVDDASPDRSFQICEEYAARDSRVRVIRHGANQGLGPARNSGISAARGDVIGFVDSDDWVAPDMYSTLYRIMIETEADIVQCSAKRMLGGNSVGSYPNSNGMNDHQTLHCMYGVSPTIVGAAWNKLYRRGLFLNNRIEYPAIIYEDVATTPRLLYCSSRVVSISDPLLYYRIRDDSIVNNRDIFSARRRVMGLLEASSILADFLMKRGCYSIEFIVNFRRYAIPQFDRDLRTLASSEGSDEALKECGASVEDLLSRDGAKLRYFFPDDDFLRQRFKGLAVR